MYIIHRKTDRGIDICHLLSNFNYGSDCDEYIKFGIPIGSSVFSFSKEIMLSGITLFEFSFGFSTLLGAA